MDRLDRKLAALNMTAATHKGDMDAWRQDVDRLYQDVAQWLSEERQRDALIVAPQEVEVREQEYGVYRMKQLAIQLAAGPLVLLVPRGMAVVGAVIQEGSRLFKARGRLDMVSFQDRRTVGLFRGEDGGWYIPTPTEPQPWARLDRQRFRDALGSLLPETGGDRAA